LRILRYLFRIIDSFTSIVLFLLLASMVVNTAVSVFFRYVLNDAISWSEEASRYLMIWMGFFGMSLATRDREHVGISFVANAMPPAGRVILRYLTDIVVLSFLVLLVILSIRQIIGSQGETTAALLLPMTVPYASVTAGGVLMALQALRRTIDMIVEDLSGTKVSERTQSGEA